ncbi:MAG: hypothetical protein Fur0042_14090 [Cyanophyceae cyanobacterium]
MVLDLPTAIIQNSVKTAFGRDRPPPPSAALDPIAVAQPSGSSPAKTQAGI